jgi:membrane protein
VTSVASLPPIPGEPIDPPPKAPPETVQGLDDADGVASTAVGVGYRALTRFNEARATLLAAGTTYYVFLAMFSLIALGYGITALFGADKIASYLTQAIGEAFPGLLGEEGIDPAELRSIGQAASIVGLVAMLYAGSGAMVAANSSIHLIYGAPKDPRNYALKRVRMLGMLVILGSLIAFSFVAGTFTVRFSDRVLTAVDLGTGPWPASSSRSQPTS